MLRLESLELSGFKSFADKLQLDFHNNVTAIVGPNGCGKSNLFDAIGWVLGAQNARNLRGEKMEDLIFNGTGKRKKSGLAQVRLTIAMDEETPVTVSGKEFLQDRIEICRRLDRSGDSHYLINQRRCRLLDIQNLLEEIGLGYSSYAFIAQGQIDRLLTGKPLDRRAVIEEAAGILAYKSRRRRAEVRLELAQQNLLRVNDIVLEVEKQLRSLKRQAAKARRYRELVTRFKEIQLARFALEHRRLTGKLEKAEEERSHLAALESQVRKDLEAAEQEHSARTRARDELESRLSSLQQNSAELRLEKDRTENSIRYLGEQSDSARRFLTANQVEQKTLRDSLESIRQERATLEKEQAELQSQESEIEQELAGSREQHRQVREAVASQEEEIEENRRKILRLSGQIASLRNLEEQLKQRQKELRARQERLEAERSCAELALQESRRRLQALLGQLQAQQGEMEKGLSQRKALEEERLRLRGEVDEATRAEGELNNRLIALRERLQSLQEVEISRSQYSEGVRKFLRHLSESRVQASGTLADRIETHPDFENLVEEFLDEELEYVLVNSMDQAFAGLEELHSLKSGKCTFMSIRTSNGFGKLGPQLAVGSKPEEGIYGTLTEILQMDEEVKDAFRRVLPIQAEAIVVADLERALSLAHSYPENTFITLRGESLSPRGLLASHTGESRKLGLLGLKRQKRELQHKIGELEGQILAAGARRSDLSHLLEEVEAALETAHSELAELEKKAIRLDHSREEFEKDVARQQRTLRVAEDEIEEVDREADKLAERLSQTRQQLTQCEGELQTAEKSLQAGLGRVSQSQAEAQRVQDHVHALDSQKQVLVERRAALESTLRRIDEQRQSLSRRSQDAVQKAGETETRIRELEADQQSKRSRLSQLDREDRELQEELERARGAYEEWRKEQPEQEGRLKALRVRASEIREERAGLDIEQARLETHYQTLEEQCREQAHQSLAEVAKGAPVEAVDRDQILAEFEELREKLDSFGPVNMTALEEYQEHEERHQFLTSQRADIESSIADTQKAIRDLNRRSRERFAEAFEAVNRYFRQYFEKLFGGGECGMQLLDEEDLLESGIDLFAQPPGKRLQNVMLLSGGEKALTVLALLMGLFAFRPSRFCVLDEVDAPLDDANVLRFANLIHELSEKIQMILITHNKRTMEIADVLYGVTMQEPGVSQVVSVEF